MHAIGESLGVHGAIGLAGSKPLAGALCAVHAVEILNYLGIPLFPHDPPRQEAYRQRRRW